MRVIVCCFAGSIDRLGALSPAAGVWHRILPLEDAGLTFVPAPGAHRERSAADKPQQNSKDNNFCTFAKAIRFPAVNNKPGVDINAT